MGSSSALEARFPQADVVTVSARTGADLDAWFGRLSGPLASRPSMDVDYDVYAEGEALLGWLNATCRVSSAQPFDGNQFLQRIADRIQQRTCGSRNRNRALQDDALAGYRQRPRGAEPGANRRSRGDPTPARRAI